MKHFLYLILFSFSTTRVFAQNANIIKEYATKPVWIAMMNDTNANYHEAILAYETYWINNTKPNGESDMDVTKTTKNKKRFSKQEIKEARQEAEMRMQIKKFDWWKNKMEPFVKDDGSIMTPSQRLKIYSNN
jgi:hypothetical protein